MDDWEERGPRAEDVASKWDILNFEFRFVDFLYLNLYT